MPEPTLRVRVEGARVINAEAMLELAGPLAFGRRDKGEPEPVSLHTVGNETRIILAPREKVSVPRRWFVVDSAGADKCTVTNISRKDVQAPVRVDDRELVQAGETRTFLLPITIPIDDVRIIIEPLDDTGQIEGLAEQSLVPDIGRRTITAASMTFAQTVNDPARILDWLQGILGVLQSAANPPDFFQAAASVLVTLVGMDSGRVLRRENGVWSAVAEIPAVAGWKPSNRLIERAVQEKRTYRHVRDANSRAAGSGSLEGIVSAVVAPVLNSKGEVIAILYGEKRKMSNAITPTDAKLVEVLAWGVATGLARMEQEAAVVRQRTRLEQFFGPQLAGHLEANENLLDSKSTEVSVLFADIRKFSTISHNLGPKKTMGLIHSILSELCECVLAEEGVLVDFAGDDILAMWGAPVEQPDHADRACRAALAMLKVLPALNEKWKGAISDNAIDVGIGINSGPAEVGNVGSEQKFKYGPLGSVVNLASRIQGLTKYFKTRPLITEQTRSLLKRPVPMRLLSQVRVVNIPDAVKIYELAAEPNDTWQHLKAHYEDALAAFERADFATATRLVGNLVTDPLYRRDWPSLVLMQRATRHLIDPPEKFDPVDTMANK